MKRRHAALSYQVRQSLADQLWAAYQAMAAAHPARKEALYDTYCKAQASLASQP